MPRRYSDYPDYYITWNIVARVGSIISILSVFFILWIFWEALASHRVATFVKASRSAIEFTHSFPPKDHSYPSIPLLNVVRL